MMMQQPEDKWFIRGDLRLHYLDWGNPGAAPMVLLHHHIGNAHYWDFFAQGMRSDYLVIAVDRRGCGESSWMENYSQGEYVVDLAGLFDELELNGIVLIGHSLGGIDAMNYTAQHPDRVSRLVIVDIGPELSPEGLQKFGKRMAGIPLYFDSKEEYVEAMKQAEPYYTEEFIHHLAGHILKRDDSGRLVSQCDQALIYADLGSLEPLWTALERITCPTLVLRGVESELLSPDTARRMVQTLPCGTMIEIERARHNLPGDNPGAFETAVRRFLDG